ncbi:outer membrane protein assembly factor BamB [Legionella sp. km772]|uniref:outer membrane protein assembly factor BamB n=1 Tax=Legionella sp. km772 TaxID=2498111 RepID=UPI000F8E159D|nr:outer membrane protein assembly factor BamB [Legionella sp. km772]RUR12821.1 outer membrane protein assembly factor BamB [Legionella sp. km772]
MKSKLLTLALCVLVQGCTKIDDYMLGKDNTPQPKELKQIDSKLKITQNWSAPVGKSNKNLGYLKLQPVAKGGVIYTADASGLVQAVRESNGAIKWSTSLKHNLVSGPSVSAGVIAVGTNNSSLVLLDQTSGKELWQTNLSGELLSAPAIAHHKVIAKTIDGKVYAFDQASGKQLWMVDHGSPNLILKASSSPVIVGNQVLIGFSDGKLEAMELDSGRMVWQRSMAYATGSSDVERLVDIDADPIIKSSVAYLATYQGYIGALSLDNGEFLWKKPGSVYKNILFHSNTLFITDSNDVLWSIDSKTGHVNWKQTALKARGLTEPVLIGNDLVVGDKNGYLHFLDTQAGDLLARSQVSGGVSSAPVAVGRKLYVLTNNGMLNQLTVS